MNKKFITKIFLNTYPRFKINKIEELRFKKYLVFAKKMNKCLVFKIAYDEHSKKKLINEFNGQKDYKKFKGKNFFIWNVKKFFLNKKYPGIQTKFINMKKGSFFNFKVLFFKKNKVICKSKTCKDYIV